MLKAVKSLATTRTANAIATRPRIVDWLSGPSACVKCSSRSLSRSLALKEWSPNASELAARERGAAISKQPNVPLEGYGVFCRVRLEAV